MEITYHFNKEELNNLYKVLKDIESPHGAFEDVSKRMNIIKAHIDNILKRMDVLNKTDVDDCIRICDETNSIQGEILALLKELAYTTYSLSLMQEIVTTGNGDKMKNKLLKKRLF